MPKSRKQALLPALRGLQRVAMSAFELEMRTSVVPIRALREAGHDVRVARFAASQHAQFSMFIGNGLEVGERLVKDAT